MYGQSIRKKANQFLSDKEACVPVYFLLAGKEISIQSIQSARPGLIPRDSGESFSLSCYLPGKSLLVPKRQAGISSPEYLIGNHLALLAFPIYLLCPELDCRSNKLLVFIPNTNQLYLYREAFFLTLPYLSRSGSPNPLIEIEKKEIPVTFSRKIFRSFCKAKQVRVRVPK